MSNLACFFMMKAFGGTFFRDTFLKSGKIRPSRVATKARSHSSSVFTAAQNYTLEMNWCELWKKYESRFWQDLQCSPFDYEFTKWTKWIVCNAPKTGGHFLQCHNRNMGLSVIVLLQDFLPPRQNLSQRSIFYPLVFCSILCHENIELNTFRVSMG